MLGLAPGSLFGQGDLQLHPIVEIGGSVDDAELLLERSEIAWDGGTGPFLIAPVSTPWQYATYSMSGDFLALHGERGEGPGQNEAVSDPVALPGRFALFGTRSFLTDADGEFSEPVSQLRVVNDASYAGEDRLLIASTAYSGDRISLVALPEMTPIRSYFATADPSEHDMGMFAFVSQPTGGQFAASSPADCRATVFDLESGAPLREVDAGGWCTPWTSPYDAREPRALRPRSQIVDVRLLQDGTVWFIGLVPDRAWQPDSDQAHRIFDTVVEIVRPDGSRTEARLDGRPLTALDGPWVATTSATDVGVISITVWGTLAPNVPIP